MIQSSPARRQPLLATASLLLTCAIFLAPASVLGQEMQVNTYTGDRVQSAPDIARLADGSFIATWQSLFQDSTSWDIYARRLDASGAPIGNEFLVSSNPDRSEKSPAVSPLDSGGFVVVWASTIGTPQSLGGRIFDAAGDPVGNELIFDSSPDLEPELDVAPAGAGFALVWAKDVDDASGGIRFRRFDAVGTPLGTEIQVSDSPPTADTGSFPKVLELADDRFVVTWQSLTSTGDDDDDTSIQARFVDAAGVGLGSPVQVNTNTYYRQVSPSVAQAADGTLLFLWSGYQSEQSGPNGRDIAGQRIDVSGSFLGSELQINTNTGGPQFYPVLVPTPNGFFAAWRTNHPAAPGFEWDLSGRHFGADGVPDGPERRIVFEGDEIAVSSTGSGRPLAIYEADRGLGTAADIYVRPVPSFSMLANPIDTGAQCQGDALSFDLELLPDGGVLGPDPVTLSAPSFPGVAFDTNPATPPTTIGLTIDTTSDFSAEVLILGNDGSASDELLVPYTLLRNPPNPPTVLYPADGATELPIRPNFSWQPFHHNDAVAFQIATDPAFTQVVSSFAGPADPSFGTGPHYVRAPAPLEHGREYFWRMATEPVCPTDPETPPWSAVRSFRASYAQYLTVFDPMSTEWIIFYRPAILGGGTDFALMFYRFTCVAPTCGSSSELNLELLTFAEPSGPPVESVLHPCSISVNLPCPTDGAIAGHPSKAEAFSAWLLPYESLDLRRIQYRRFEADGNGLGFLRTLDRDGSVRSLAAANAETGSVVAWFEETPGGESGIYAQRVSPVGAPLGSPLLVHSSPTVQRDSPAVAIDSSTGNFAVIWASRWNPAINAADWIIEARFFDIDGNPLNATFKVNVADSGEQREPDIVAGPGGSFLATWQSETSLADDNSDESIQSRRISPASPTGAPELQVNSTFLGPQTAPSLAYDPASDQFLVAWHNPTSGDSSLEARRLNGAGVPLDSDFRIDNGSDDGVSDPTVLADSLNGNFLVVWQDRFAAVRRATIPTTTPLFQDGFESGDFTAWAEP